MSSNKELLIKQALLAVEKFADEEHYKQLLQAAQDNPELQGAIIWVLNSMKRQFVQYIVTLNVASKFDEETAKKIIDTSRDVINETLKATIERPTPKRPMLRVVK
jgi:hypothetical protein